MRRYLETSGLAMRMLLWSLLLLMMLGAGQVWAGTNDVERRIERLEDLVAELTAEVADQNRSVQAQLRGINRDLEDVLELIAGNKTWIESLIHQKNWTLTELMATLMTQQEVLDTVYDTLESSLMELDTEPAVVEAPTRVVDEQALTPLSLWSLEGQPYRKTGDVDNYSLNTRESATVGGVTYEDVIRVHSVNNRRSITYWFNLDVGRERLKGKAAIEDVGESEVQLSAYDSGEEVFSQTFYPGALPQAFDFDISGISILQLKFESGYAGGARLVLMSP